MGLVQLRDDLGRETRWNVEAPPGLAAPHLETRPSRRLEGSFSGLCFSSTNISGLVSNCKS
jgi:hypothetical protein